MANPVICVRDTSIKNGQLLIKDLWPNRSQASAVIDPTPQGPRYLRVVENATPVVANNAVSNNVKGLSAYLLVTIDVQTNGANPTPTQAGLMATAILTEMRAGNALTLALINTAIQASDPGLNATGIVGTGVSTATVQNILNILGGASFTVSAGTSVANSYLTGAQQTSAFNSSVYQAIDPNDSSFYISVAEGDLSKAKNYRVNPRDANTPLDPFVVIYDSTGAVL